MSKPLPVVSGRDTLRALEHLGFAKNRQRGSHVVLHHAAKRITLTVPDHRELDRGTLRAILRHAGVTVEQFIAALDA